MARLRCQRYLEGLVGEEQCRGVHVVLARESWFQPEQFRSQEPSTASVVDMEAQLWPSKPMHLLVEKMCVVGNSWPLCLARAMGLRREKERRLRRRGMFREAYARKKFCKRHRGATGREQQARAEAAAAHSPATGAGEEGAGDAAAGVDASGPPGESGDAPSESFFSEDASDSPARSDTCALADMCPLGSVPSVDAGCPLAEQPLAGPASGGAFRAAAGVDASGPPGGSDDAPSESFDGHVRFG